MSDFEFVVGRVSFVTPSKGGNYSDVEIDGKKWVYLSEDEVVPKKGDYLRVKCFKNSNGKSIVVNYVHLTQPERQSLLEARGESVRVQNEGEFIAELDRQAFKFGLCWKEAMKIGGYKDFSHLKVSSDPEAAGVVYKIAFTLFNEVRNKK